MELLECVVEAGLDGPGRDTESKRDLLNRQVAEIAQRDDHLLVRRKGGDGATNFVTVVRRTELVARRDFQLGRDVLSLETAGAGGAGGGRGGEGGVGTMV